MQNAANPRVELEDRIATLLCLHSSHNSAPGNRLTDYYKQLRGTLAGYSMRTLSLLERTAENQTQGRNLFDLIFHREPSEEYLLDSHALTPAKRSLGMGTVEFVPYLNSIASYENLDPIIDGHYTAKRLAQTTAILRTAQYLRKVDGALRALEAEHLPVFINDDDLRNLLTTHEDPQLIAGLITDRGLTSAEEITAILRTMDESHGSLRNGTL